MLVFKIQTLLYNIYLQFFILVIQKIYVFYLSFSEVGTKMVIPVSVN